MKLIFSNTAMSVAKVLAVYTRCIVLENIDCRYKNHIGYYDVLLFVFFANGYGYAC